MRARSGGACCRVSHYYVVPDFEGVDFEVMIDPAFPPFVDLPLSEPSASLLPRFERATASGGWMDSRYGSQQLPIGDWISAFCSAAAAESGNT